MARITTIPLFTKRTLSAGDSGTSDPIDLRYSANNGYFSLFVLAKNGTFGSAGTTTFRYVGCSTFNGIYIPPKPGEGTIGTACTASTTGTCIMSFQPELTPWMRIITTQVGSGTAGADSLVTAELNMQ